MAIDLTGKSLEELYTLAKSTLEKAKSAEKTADKDAAEGELEDIIKKYNTKARDTCYADCREAEKPLAYAILRCYYEGIADKTTEDKKNGTVKRDIEKVRRPIDISSLWKWMRDGEKSCGADPRWFHYAEKLNYLMTVRAAERLGHPAFVALLRAYRNDYRMSDIANKFAEGKNPTSNTQLNHALESLLHAMLGEEYKITSRDFNALCELYVKDNKKEALGVSLPNHNAFRGILKKICYRILTGNIAYSIDTREFNLKAALEKAEAVAGKKSEPAKSEEESVPVDEAASDEPAAE